MITNPAFSWHPANIFYSSNDINEVAISTSQTASVPAILITLFVITFIFVIYKRG